MAGGCCGEVTGSGGQLKGLRGRAEMVADTLAVVTAGCAIHWLVETGNEPHEPGLQRLQAPAGG